MKNLKVCACGAPWEHRDVKLNAIPYRPSPLTTSDSLFCLDWTKTGEPVTRAVPMPMGAWQGPANPENCPSPKILFVAP